MKSTIPAQAELQPGPTIPVPAGRHDGHQHHGSDHHHGWETADVVRVLFVAVAAAAVWFHWYEPVSSFSLTGVAATLIGGYPIFREALENILERRMTMELSMTIALLAALAIKEFFTALIITLFVLAAEILEGLTMSRGRKAIEDLVNLLPQTAEVFRDGKLIAPQNALAASLTLMTQSPSCCPTKNSTTSRLSSSSSEESQWLGTGSMTHPLWPRLTLVLLWAPVLMLQGKAPTSC